MTEVTHLPIDEPDPALAESLRLALSELFDPATRRLPVADEVVLHVIGPNVTDVHLDVALGRGHLALVLVWPHQSERLIRALDMGAADGLVWRDVEGSSSELRLRARAALERTRTARLLEHERKDLAALLQLSQTLNDAGDMEGTLFHIAKQVAEVMKSERCSIILLDDDGDHGYVVATSDDATLRGHPIAVKTHYPEISEVVRTRAPLVVDDVSRAPLFDRVRELLRGKAVGNTAIFPVFLNDKVCGVIHVRGAAARTSWLSPHQAQFGAIVANATAIALRNARLLQRVRDRAERVSTARVRAERRLKQLENYQRFFDLAGDGLVIVDGKGRFLFANREASTILGFHAGDLTQLGFNDIVAEEGEARLAELLDGFRRGDHKRRVDLPVLRATGEVAVLSLSTASLDPEGEDKEADTAAIISFRDVTATRKMERELRKTKDFLESVIESSADAVVAADIKGTILLFNSGAERITGYTRAEVVGKKSAEILYPTGVARELMRRMRSAEHGGVGRYHSAREELSIRSGETIPISLSAALIYDHGREVASVGIFSDLRDRIRMEGELQHAQMKLELSERQSAIVELAGAAAHELSQPLTSILGSTELAQRKVPEGSPAAVQLARILTECERMAAIVKNIGRITRYETKPYVGMTQIVDLSASSASGSQPVLPATDPPRNAR